MYIQFTEDYNDYKCGQTIKTNGVKGFLLTKKGVAVELPNATPIEDIVVAQYITNLSPSPEVPFIAKRSLFKYVNKQPVHEVETGIFIDLITGEEILPDNHIDAPKVIDKSNMIFSKSKCGFSVYFQKELETMPYQLEYLSDDQLTKYYNKLNPIMEHQLELPN